MLIKELAPSQALEVHRLETELDKKELKEISEKVNSAKFLLEDVVSLRGCMEYTRYIFREINTNIELEIDHHSNAIVLKNRTRRELKEKMYLYLLQQAHKKVCQESKMEIGEVL